MVEIVSGVTEFLDRGIQGDIVFVYRYQDVSIGTISYGRMHSRLMPSSCPGVEVEAANGSSL